MKTTWEVIWIVEGKTVSIDCEANLAEAVRIYTLAVRGNRRGVTLRCKNTGFAPPKKLQPYTYKKTKQSEPVIVEPLSSYNTRGVWWCPYCLKLRRFVKRAGFYTDDVYVRKSGYHCAFCGISHRDHHVRKWNPLAMRVLLAEGKSTDAR